ncbi:hypothetical protein ACFWG5_34980 [Streptomyces hydrogenans]|uniref:hypothetical protein n=1 Tax=Streptomyces hydrogenans TaxID=1873719 RepID=UPI0036699548
MPREGGPGLIQEALTQVVGDLVPQDEHFGVEDVHEVPDRGAEVGNAAAVMYQALLK